MQGRYKREAYFFSRPWLSQTRLETLLGMEISYNLVSPGSRRPKHDGPRGAEAAWLNEPEHNLQQQLRLARWDRVGCSFPSSEELT